MNRKNLKAMIKASALKEMPDILNRIDLESVEIIPETKTRFKFSFNMRRVLTFSFSFLFLGVFSLFVYSTFINPPASYTPLETEAQVLAFQAISAASLLDEIDATPLSFEVTPVLFDPTPYSVDTTTVLENEIDVINQYLNMMEIVLGDTTTMVTSEVESDDLAYQYEIIYRNVDLVGNLIEFKFYYNLTEGETTSTLNGILYHDLDSFVIEGELSNTDGTFTSLNAYMNEFRYVTVEDLSTDSMQQFRYKVYAFNALQNEGDVSLSINDEILMASIDTSGQSCSFMLNVERVKSTNGAKFQVKYSIKTGAVTGDGDFEVGVEFNTMMGSYIYKYKMTSNGNQQEFSCGRGYKGNHQATDDDFTMMTQNTNTNNGHHGRNNPTQPSMMPDGSDIAQTEILFSSSI